MQCQVFCDEEKMSVIDELSNDVRVGRKPKDEDLSHSTIDGITYIYLNSQAVSAQHLQVQCEENEIVFTDTSRNGTLLCYNDKEEHIKQQSTTVEGFKDIEFVVTIKAKETEFKLIFEHQSLTQSKNRTQDMENTLAATNEPVQKPSVSSSASTPKNKSKKRSAPETDQQEEPKPKKAKKAAKADVEEEEDKPKAKKASKKAASESVPKAKKQKKSATSKPVEDSESDGAPSGSYDNDNTGEIELESDSLPSFSSDEMEENKEEFSASISLAEAQNFEDAVDIDDFKKQNPRFLFPEPLERCNFSFKVFMKDFYIHDEGRFWNSSLSEDELSLLSSFATLDEGLNPSKIVAMFTSKLRTTSRFLLAVLCGLPIFSNQLLHTEVNEHAIKHALRIHNPSAFLYEPTNEETSIIGSEFAELRDKYFEKYSLTEVCRRNARHRMVVKHSLVVTEESVLGHECEDEDDIYAFISFCYVLVELGLSLRIITHEIAACKHERSMMSGKAGLRADLIPAPEEDYEGFLTKQCDDSWMLLLKDKEQFSGVKAKKMLKVGLVSTIFLAEDVTSQFIL